MLPKRQKKELVCTAALAFPSTESWASAWLIEMCWRTQNPSGVLSSLGYSWE